MANLTNSSPEINADPAGCIDVIHKAMMHLASADYSHRTLPELLELLEDGEEWVKKMRDFLGAEQ